MATWKHLALGAAALVLTPLALVPCAATAAAAPRMTVGADVAAPSGFREFCAREPDGCAGREARSDAAPLVVEAGRKALLQQVNREVNDLIAPDDDARIYGVSEMWVNPLADQARGARRQARGDCEDYALAKRDRLIALGWAPEALFLAVGYHQSYGLHAVLIARTDEGDMVLDSRTPWIEPWSQTAYVWVKRQLAADSAVWVRPYETAWSEAAAPDATTGALPGRGR